MDFKKTVKDGYNIQTYLGLLRQAGFKLLLQREVRDASCPGSKHLFVLAQKEGAQMRSGNR